MGMDDGNVASSPLNLSEPIKSEGRIPMGHISNDEGEGGLHFKDVIMPRFRLTIIQAWILFGAFGE